MWVEGLAVQTIMLIPLIFPFESIFRYPPRSCSDARRGAVVLVAVGLAAARIRTRRGHHHVLIETRIGTGRFDGMSRCARSV